METDFQSTAGDGRLPHMVFFLNSICFLNQLLGEVEPFKGAQATQAMAICWHGLCLDSTHIFYTCAIT